MGIEITHHLVDAWRGRMRGLVVRSHAEGDKPEAIPRRGRIEARGNRYGVVDQFDAPQGRRQYRYAPAVASVDEGIGRQGIGEGGGEPALPHGPEQDEGVPAARPYEASGSEQGAHGVFIAPVPV